MGVMTIDMSSIGIKFENFMQAGCRDQGSHHGRNVYCRNPISLPKVVLFFWNIFRIASTAFHYLWFCAAFLLAKWDENYYKLTYFCIVIKNLSI